MDICVHEMFVITIMKPTLCSYVLYCRSWGETINHTSSVLSIESSGITCRLTVDLKGVLRFIANKEEERREQPNSGLAEISVTHIVLSALAQSMPKLNEFKKTRIYYPWLWIDGYLDEQHEENKSTAEIDSLTIAIMTKKGHLIRVPNAAQRTVQDIADHIANAEKGLEKSEPKHHAPPHTSVVDALTQWLQAGRILQLLGIPNIDSQEQQEIPKCIVMATPDSDHCQVDMDCFLRGIPVTVVVSGVRLAERRPTLSM